ncbi:MAG: 50S ribosomal protein L23 [Planctomycetaceae bacterium]
MLNAASDMLETYQVLISTLVTEKSTFLRAAPLNKFTFRVPVAATKTQVRKAVEDAFGVKVVSVATQRCKELAVRYRFNRGLTAEWKKAIVTINKEQTLPV